jgi:hypothetical protein
MSASLTVAPERNRLAVLRRRESATGAMIRQIDEKLARLNAARCDRAEALKRIRYELVRALKAEPVAAALDEHLV